MKHYCVDCVKKRYCNKLCSDIEKLLPKERTGIIRNRISIPVSEKDKYAQNLDRVFHRGFQRLLQRLPDADIMRRIADVSKKGRKYRWNIIYRDKKIARQSKYYYLHKEYFILYRIWRKSIKDFEPRLSKRGNILGRKAGSKDLRPRKKEGYFNRICKEDT